MGKKRKVAGGEDGEVAIEAAAPKVLLMRELFRVRTCFSRWPSRRRRG
jgi:hypothetical protein